MLSDVTFRAPALGLPSASLLILAALLAAGAAAAQPQSPADEAGKIGFDLGTLDENGLLGGPGSKRALDYELCIPADEASRAEVGAIDDSARFYPNSRGRIGCAPDRVLVIGNTHRRNYAGVLRRLAELPYVERIEQTYFE